MLITSVHNPRVKAAARLRERSARDEQGRIIIDGVREIGRALASGVALQEIYCFTALCDDDKHQQLLADAKRAGAEIVEVSPQIIEKLSFGQRVTGLVAVGHRPQRTLHEVQISANALVAIIEGAEKPGNLGAIVRTANAAGVSAVIVADGGTDVYNPNAIRASLGAIFCMPVVAATSEDALAWLHERNFQVFAARVDGSIDYTAADFRGRAAIALGSEAHGLSERWRAEDIIGVRLPLLGSVDSLNLSATAAVLFYEALRQRQAT
jgi:RNA methyltransferase, TrmH family